ncbi:Pca regulon regulatory protein [Variovorax sp. SRS16]|uniref:IclR family transcriptional regulator n=1 Tax=Variovorax sp. SRS16 TaxID=282217 RepID=UPI0013190AED|nr:IclR family transcriptional regulator [Variovorax sp. SRS16]VTU28174.1 Pca regulon regulatory protein [Variovorax sp. SRS16]
MARPSPVRKTKPEPKPARSSLFVNSVDKAMKVMTAFDGSKRHLTLSQIAAATDMDMSSAQRFTYTLAELGFLKKDEENKSYELSPRLLDFAYHYLSSNELLSRATPYLLQLSRETSETTNVTVLDGTDIVFVQRIVSQHVLNPNVVVGSRSPAYCTAPGLAMLAHLPGEQVDAILARSTLVQHTPHTVVQPRAIKARLEKIRAIGYAHTEEEYYLGDISTASAILDARGHPVAAINVAMVKPRWTGPDIERRISDLVISAASVISARR